jgi:hypothetical protein
MALRVSTRATLTSRMGKFPESNVVDVEVFCTINAGLTPAPRDMDKVAVVL